MNDIASKCVNKAINIWKKSKKTITYSDSLSSRERALIHTDPEIASLALEIKDIERRIQARLNLLLQLIGRSLKLKRVKKLKIIFD